MAVFGTIGDGPNGPPQHKVRNWPVETMDRAPPAAAFLAASGVSVPPRPGFGRGAKSGRMRGDASPLPRPAVSPTAPA